jgi:transposase
MNPFPEKNSVLVMDNVKFHLADEVRELLDERYFMLFYDHYFLTDECSRGIHVVFLPPYSPDLNPIEAAFSSVKAWIRRHNTEIRAAMESPDSEDGITALTMAVMESVTPQKANGWYRDSGYY